MYAHSSYKPSQRDPYKGHILCVIIKSFSSFRLSFIFFYYFPFFRVDISSKSSIFWDITPCSPLKVNRRFGRTCRCHLQVGRMIQGRNKSEAGRLLAACFMLVSCLDYSSTLKIEAIYFSEMSDEFHRTTR
jgi:hypothetical protein